MWASVGIFEFIRKDSIWYSGSWAKSRNNIFLWWWEITSNMYSTRVIWNFWLIHTFTMNNSTINTNPTCLSFCQPIQILWDDTVSRVQINMICTINFSCECMILRFYWCLFAPLLWWISPMYDPAVHFLYDLNNIRQ